MNLRFKDGNGEPYPRWNKYTLGEVAELVGGGTPSTADSNFWGGEVQWFTPSEIKSKKAVQSKRTITAAGLKASSAKPLPKGTVLLTTRATLGEMAILDTEGSTTNQGFQSLIPREEVITSEFLYYLQAQIRRFCETHASGSTFREISKKSLSTMELLLPSLSEQRKIAEFFSLLDERISKQEAKVALLQKQKRGYMQRIFSQELRFKQEDGGEYPEWSYEPLENLVILSSKKKIGVLDEPSYVLELEHVQSSTGKLSPVLASNLGSAKNEFWRGDVLYSKLRPYLRKYGLPSFNGFASSEMWVLRPKDVENLAPEYLYLLVQTEVFNAKVDQSSGTKMPRASWDVAKTTELPLPAFEEQKQLTKFIQLLEDSISLEVRKLEFFHLQKRGYLSRLFS